MFEELIIFHSKNTMCNAYILCLVHFIKRRDHRFVVPWQCTLTGGAAVETTSTIEGQLQPNQSCLYSNLKQLDLVRLESRYMNWLGGTVDTVHACSGHSYRLAYSAKRLFTELDSMLQLLHQQDVNSVCG